MRSRIIAITLSVLLFFSALFIVGLPEKGNAVDTVETTEPEKVTETVICSFKDIAYGSHKDQTLDLNLPIDNRGETGLVMFLHGGGWISGDKESSKRAFSLISETRNFATASINYRLAELGQTDIYDIIDDITVALSHIKTLAAGYNVNINKVVIVGHSAGGHLALLYTYRFGDISPVRPVGVIASAPATDLTIDDFYKKNSLGDEKYMCELMSKASGEEFTAETRAAKIGLLTELTPTTYVTGSCAPTVIIHGRNDNVVPIAGSEELAYQLSINAVPTDFIIFENSGHSLEKDDDTRAYTETLLQERIASWFNTEN